jgi:N-acetylmuramoyl-L-alanine amidase
MWISKRNLISACIIIGLLTAVWFLMVPPDVAVLAPFSEAVSGKKVVIDAGHGGIDPGAKAPGITLEKNVNLDIAMHLKRLFSKAGVYVVMIRETDQDQAWRGARKKIWKRALIWRTTRGRIFFSVFTRTAFRASLGQGPRRFMTVGKQKAIPGHVLFRAN